MAVLWKSAKSVASTRKVTGRHWKTRYTKSTGNRNEMAVKPGTKFGKTTKTKPTPLKIENQDGNH